MKQNAKSWEISDDFWEFVKPHIPHRSRVEGLCYFRAPGGGRKPANLRMVLSAILYVLRTGMQWNALAKEKFGLSGSTAHRYFRFWLEAGFFEKIWELGVQRYDEIVGVRWSWQAADGATFKAPLAQEAVGPNPTDRAKAGSKRHLLVDERGIPLGIVITGANVHDSKGLPELLNAKVKLQPQNSGTKQNLCLDAAYVGSPTRDIMEKHGYTAHVRPRGEEAEDIKSRKGKKARRWIVEVVHSWFTRFRKLAVRYEKTVASCMALHHLAAALICFRKASAALNPSTS
ncbi:IS5 family transposase [Pleurocapsales cyanobacterium LEGE 06147]|nr:IS5 family transposase [Pleurocapsales cyanobacterium LEGE 06147]